MSATCREREEHIQRYLISSQPPCDNYYNISKAVYPSVDLPSLDQDRRYVRTWQYMLVLPIKKVVIAPFVLTDFLLHFPEVFSWRW